jgi:hypothetical protein
MPAASTRLHAAALFGYSCVAVAFSWPLPLHLSSALPGSPGGDTGVYVWNLWVFRHEIVAHSHFPFSTLEILAATPPVSLALHNYTTFANILAFPLLPWLGTVATFNVLVIASAIASAYAMFLFARGRTGEAGTAWIGGLLFGFSPFASARVMEHFSLVQMAPLPIFGLVLYRIWVRPTMRMAVVAGAVVAWAYLCDPYYAVYCLLTTAFTVVSSAIVLKQSADGVGNKRLVAFLDVALLCASGLILGIVIRGGGQLEVLGIRVSVTRLYNPVLLWTVLLMIRLWIIVQPRIGVRFPTLPPLRVAAAAAIACAALLAPVLYAVTTGAAGKQWMAPQVYWRSSAPGIDLLSLLTPNPLHPLFGRTVGQWLHTLPNGFVENVASVPWVVMVLIALAVAWKHCRLPRAWIAYTVFFALLALGPFIRIAGYTTHVPGPWAVLRYLPVIGAARMPTRFTAVLMLAVAMLLVFALNHLRKQTSRPRLLLTAVAALLIVELLPAPRVLYSATVPTFLNIIADDPRPMRVVHLPFGIRDGLSSRGDFSAVAQFFQTFHEKPLIGGYLSRLPDGEVERFRKVPVLRVLMRLSEGRQADADTKSGGLETAAEDRERLRIGYVIVDRTRVSDELLAFARKAFDMRSIAVDGDWELYAVGAKNAVR